jgi:hypothetical protein
MVVNQMWPSKRKKTEVKKGNQQEAHFPSSRHVKLKMNLNPVLMNSIHKIDYKVCELMCSSFAVESNFNNEFPAIVYKICLNQKKDLM